MQTVSTVTDVREALSDWRACGERIALVPTLGNLHRGHESLMQVARQCADRVLASIFVNPTQFGLGEDYENYPRTMEADQRCLQAAGVDALYAPTVEEVYPNGHSSSTHVEVPRLSNILCGAARPGHFVGVATVVCKLFNMVHPDFGVFGEKDWQQLLVIRRMVSDLSVPVEIIGAPTVRDRDGLATSSRNAYMTPDERKKAPKLHAIMLEAAKALCEGREHFVQIERQSIEGLTEVGFKPDYFAIRRSADLCEPEPEDRVEDLRIVAAAWLGRARLIDNIPVL